MQPPSLSNVLPSPRTANRIAFVMPFPSADDVRIGKPLSGCGGALLRGVLASVGLALDDCALCYVCQHAIGSFESAGWESGVVQDGIAQLAADLASWRPNIVVALDDPRLGSGATHLLHAGNVAPPRTGKKGYAWPASVNKWRGSLFTSQSFNPVLTTSGLSSVAAEPTTDAPKGQGDIVGRTGSAILPTGTNLLDGGRVVEVCQSGDGTPPTLVQIQPVQRSFKSMATYAPAFIATVGYAKLFDLRSDVRRARDESTTPNLNLPQLNICYGPCE